MASITVNHMLGGHLASPCSKHYLVVTESCATERLYMSWRAALLLNASPKLFEESLRTHFVTLWES